jgi:hypothetical protein
MNLTVMLSAALGLVAGVVLALKVVAPLTATKVDDDVLKRLESLEEVLKKLQG